MTQSISRPASSPTNLDYSIEQAVIERYEAGAQAPQPSLCCPTDYEGNYLAILPQEIIEKDYGCGDPTRFVNVGETVVDLGSGAGKNCYILAQKVGAEGRVIGVDFNDEMLTLARKYVDPMALKLGYSNTQFVKGKIQDLGLSLDLVAAWLREHPVSDLEGVAAYEAECDRLRREIPLVESDSVDVVISNCVLNLVRPEDKQQLFGEIFRVLKRGGRAVISDIVCDETPTAEILNDPELWSGCIAGAFREDEFLAMFEQAGFYGVEILVQQSEPWQTIDGIEFRSVTVRAFKGKEGACLDCKQAVVYKGPWKSVQDDDGHTLYRGQRMAVCAKTFDIYTSPRGPYSPDVIGLEPYDPVPPDSAPEFNCAINAIRAPREMKGADYTVTSTAEPTSCCEPQSSCC
ncbi:methyltransferase domain-containing protein [Synechococcus sp. PCC 7336]|uniref:methyltransferase domain-containing protein n=1 Tax=Synechococcus sp. PCC 7336 TaxID=195250 RepID=UPI0005713937|nr:methyltransferase domain-containing protein [Synechococcus sp. PCC 7336]